MRPHPSFDRPLLIAIAIGLVSLLGLLWIFSKSDLGEALIPPTAVPTAIPFDISTLKAEILSTLPSATPTLEDRPPAATESSSASSPEPLTEKVLPVSTMITESGAASSATPTPDQGQVLSAGKYDDTDPNIAYDRFWSFERNSGTKYAYQGTLHISTGIGNELSFRFTGQRFNLGYQRGKNFGIVTVLIDDQPYSFHEQALGNIWQSPQLSAGTHSVRLIQESGESINLDYIEVVG
jgi:hypothetical protein